MNGLIKFMFAIIHSLWRDGSTPHALFETPVEPVLDVDEC